MNRRDGLKDLEQKIKSQSRIRIGEKKFNYIHQNLMNVAESIDRKERRGGFLKKLAFGFGSVAAGLLILVLCLSLSDITDSDAGQASRGSDNEASSEQSKVSYNDKESENASQNYTTVEGAIGDAKVIESEFDPSLIGFYTGKPMKFDQYNLDDVEAGVYVHGVKTHSDQQAFTVYSKVSKNTAQTVSLKIEEEILKIIVQVEQASSESEAEQNKVLQTLLNEKPTKFEVYRNGVLEKKEEIIYAIE
ncbi:hypothetical protein [Alkalihalobacillus sp. AL-G]|uniref:hypothetical protein n=1 Tax=Alkalihalobacillus sp. AL-G TaxID=2926399 RepID=UPI00272AA34B|nr:hypothetical protein [Alkalihalobacillus sp. AL-G]WLD93260.1 hypothetical protein MOJ78_20065 [Alkalihalobacillus sp. AL-G]